MTPKKDVLATSEVVLPRFRAGQVARVFGFEMWQFQRFLERHTIAPAKQFGKGRGSLRLFSQNDIYRIGIALRLITDGFGHKIVREALRQIDDSDLVEVDAQGRDIYGGIAFRRGKKGPEMEIFRSGSLPEIKPSGPYYYAFDFGNLIREIDRRTATVEGKK